MKKIILPPTFTEIFYLPKNKNVKEKLRIS